MTLELDTTICFECRNNPVKKISCSGKENCMVAITYKNGYFDTAWYMLKNKISNT